MGWSDPKPHALPHVASQSDYSMRFPIAVLSLILAPLAADAELTSRETIQGFYAGAGIGNSGPTSWDSESWYNGDDDYNDSGDGDSDSSVSLFAGYRFNRYLAAELGWLDAGTMGWSQSRVYIPELLDEYNTDVDLDVTTVNASVIGILPFGRIWEAYILGGAAFYDASADQRLTPSFGGPVVQRNIDESNTDFLFGIGIGVTVFDHAHVRLGFQSFFIDDDLLAAEDESSTVDSLLLDVQYRFGGGWQSGAE